MAIEPVQRYKGPVSIDLEPEAPILVDMKRGQRQFLRSQREGIEEVIHELKMAVPTLGVRAAISAEVYAHFVESIENIAKLRSKRALVVKLAEVLLETEAYYEHQCETDISILCDAIRSSARRQDPSIRAAFEKTLKYNSQIAQKSLRTRRRKAKGEREADDASQPAPEPAAGKPA